MLSSSPVGLQDISDTSLPLEPIPSSSGHGHGDSPGRPNALQPSLHNVHQYNVGKSSRKHGTHRRHHNGHKPNHHDRKGGEFSTTPRYDARHFFDMNIDGSLVVQLVIIVILWTMFVLNTELLIRYNFSSAGGDNAWQFGQVLPMFLILLPLVSLIRAFGEHGLRKDMHTVYLHRGRRHRRRRRDGERGEKNMVRQRSTSEMTRRGTEMTMSASGLAPAIPPSAYHRQRPSDQTLQNGGALQLTMANSSQPEGSQISHDQH